MEEILVNDFLILDDGGFEKNANKGVDLITDNIFTVI